MLNVSPVTFHDDDNTDAFDDIDNLFHQLEHFEPPADMVARIMDTVSKLPLPQVEQPSLKNNKDGLVVRRQHKRPS